MTTNLRYVRMKQPGIRSRDTRCKKANHAYEIIVGPFFCYIEKYISIGSQAWDHSEISFISIIRRCVSRDREIEREGRSSRKWR
jgi:hypothetical protein